MTEEPAAPLPSPSDAPLHTGRRDEAFIDRLTALIEAGLSSDNLAKLKKDFDDAATEALDRFEWYVKDDMAGELARYVQEMADRSIEALLAGNEAEMRRYLTCEKGAWNGRTCELASDDGRLFEFGGLKLRKQIVDAFPELLKDERILDLEAQVAALQELVDKKNCEIMRLRDELR